MDSGSRIIEVAIADCLITEMFTQGWEVGGENHIVRCVDGLPDGARLVATYNDMTSRCAIYVYQHDSFEMVPIGSRPPRIVIVHQKEDINDD